MRTKTVERKAGKSVQQNGQGESLPDGWRWVNLGEICVIFNGFAFKSADFVHEGIPVLKMGNVGKNFDLVWNTSKMSFLPESHLDDYEKFIVQKNDLLITLTDMSPSGEYLGTVAIFDREIPALLNQRVGRFVLNEDQVNSTYLYFRLRSRDFREYVTRDDTGNLQKNTNPKYIYNFRFPLPPIAEQKRIVGILSDRLATIDQARLATEAQLEAAQALPAAYLRQIFNSPEAQKWEKKSFGSLALSVQNGIYKKSEFYGHGHPFLRMYNIHNNSWNLSFHETTQVEVDDNELKKFSLKKGDILISRVNSFELVGKSGWVCERAEGNVFENMLIRVRLKDNINSMFVAQQLRTPAIRKQIEEVAKRAIGQSSINSTDVRNLELLMPSPEKQAKFSSLINEKISQIEEVISSLQDQLDTINAFPAALLRQAFNGEL
ncbi:restriction endonuclease subunit S [Sphaerothrix gracilis]|uniref:restriction endonuclease subunit S n=1 Tax=Sphaerothrix gracilis TaxID=3151835 RepID=UPI0031FDD3D7